MYYVAWVRESGCLCADAQIFESREEAEAWYGVRKRSGDFGGIKEFESEVGAQNEVDYQTQTSFGN